LEVGRHSAIGADAVIYNKAKVVIKEHCVVSQGAFLCTASHDITDRRNPLITAPIVVESHAWVATEAFVMMGTTIGQGAVVGARAAVFKDVEPWTVVGGNPAKFIKKREINQL
jgi:putative colanic acid biosynthesis acetyltransferase WcaF